MLSETELGNYVTWLFNYWLIIGQLKYTYIDIIKLGN